MRVCVWGWGMRMLPYLKGKIKHGWIYATVILTLFRPINQHLPLLVRGGGTSALEWDRFCTGCADIYLQGYMSAQCPHYILLRFSALIFLWSGNSMNYMHCRWPGHKVTSSDLQMTSIDLQRSVNVILLPNLPLRHFIWLFMLTALIRFELRASKWPPNDLLWPENINLLPNPP